MDHVLFFNQPNCIETFWRQFIKAVPCSTFCFVLWTELLKRTGIMWDHRPMQSATNLHHKEFCYPVTTNDPEISFLLYSFSFLSTWSLKLLPSPHVSSISIPCLKNGSIWLNQNIQPLSSVVGTSLRFTRVSNRRLLFDNRRNPTIFDH